MNPRTLLENVERVAARFASDRSERQLRCSLDRRDFDALCEAGLHLVALPRERGGLWNGTGGSTRLACEALRTLARGDASVALVCAMHPAVLSFWLTAPLAARTARWDAQCDEIFESVRGGHWWGTITSEPGSGGDVLRTRTLARPDGDDLAFRISGSKHFGSGSGVVSFMVTTARPEGEDDPDWFFLDLRDVAWDGSHGLGLLAEWDGHGMTATQSHSAAFEDFPATRIAWPGHLREVTACSGGVILCLFTSVVAGILDVAIETARSLLAQRELGAFERVEWIRAQNEHWLACQALEGMLHAVETGEDSRVDALRGKTCVAELAESALTRLCKVLGGGTFSRRSPFGFWFEDVRALGFLRPPWPLAYETLESLAE